MDKLKKKISVVKKDFVFHHTHSSDDNHDEHDTSKEDNDSGLSSNGTLPLQQQQEYMSFTLQYLGFVEIKSPGLDEICENVDKMYTQAKPFLKNLEKTTLNIVKDGIDIGPKSDADLNSKLYKFRRILYCGVDKKHRRVFSFNYQYGSRAENIHLHVIVCRTKEDAKNLAKRLGDIFKDISVEMHRKEKEDKRKHSENLSRSRGSSKSEPNVSRSRSLKSESTASSEIEIGSPQSCGSDGIWECGVMTRSSPVCL
eukprot:gene3568-4072_t